MEASNTRVVAPRPVLPKVVHRHFCLGALEYFRLCEYVATFVFTLTLQASLYISGALFNG